METLAYIDAPHFYAGIVLSDGFVVEAADIIKYMAKQRWDLNKVRAYCALKDWNFTIIYHRKRK